MPKKLSAEPVTMYRAGGKMFATEAKAVEYRENLLAVLTDASEAFGQCSIYVGDDGQLYV